MGLQFGARHFRGRPGVTHGIVGADDAGGATDAAAEVEDSRKSRREIGVPILFPYALGKPISDPGGMSIGGAARGNGSSSSR